MCSLIGGHHSKSIRAEVLKDFLNCSRLCSLSVEAAVFPCCSNSLLLLLHRCHLNNSCTRCTRLMKSRSMR
jgi:hypothetical protein